MATNRIIPLATDTANATHAAVTITYAANSGKAHGIWNISMTYSGGTASGGKVQLKRGSTVVQEWVTGAAATFSISFEKPVGGAINEAISVVLADGGVGIVGTLNVQHELLKG
jgi:hypothetical protein